MAEIKIVIKDNPDGSMKIECLSDRPPPQNPKDCTPAEKMAVKIGEFIASLGCDHSKLH